MRIAIVGAGAVGCLIGAHLAQAGADAIFATRREDAAEILRKDGIRMTNPDGAKSVCRVKASARPDEIGPCDAVIACVKAHALSAALPAISTLMGDRGFLAPVVNGVPWWYPQGGPEILRGQGLASVDPDGALGRTIDPERILGAVTYVAVESLGDGAIRHVRSNEFKFGAPTGKAPLLAEKFVSEFRRAGFDATLVDNIRSHIWTKLWGNVSFNPLSVLTGATLGELCAFGPTRALVAQIMAEAEQVAHRLDVSFAMTLDERIDVASEVGDFKTSMLQDDLAGRKLEIEAILGVVAELGERLGVSTPSLSQTLAVMRLREKIAERESARAKS